MGMRAACLPGQRTREQQRHRSKDDTDELFHIPPPLHDPSQGQSYISETEWTIAFLVAPVFLASLLA
jgi:hypothetical protein